MNTKEYEIFTKFVNDNDLPLQLYKYRSLGGSYGNCWDDSLSYSEAEPETEWEELYDTVLLMDPNISLAKFRKILDIIEISTKKTSDYYGGSSMSENKTLDLWEAWKIIHA